MFYSWIDFVRERENDSGSGHCFVKLLQGWAVALEDIWVFFLLWSLLAEAAEGDGATQVLSGIRTSSWLMITSMDMAG